MALNYIIVVILAYIMGNIATSYWVSKMFGHIDIREHGSGNAGATNVLRVLGTKPAAITFAGDALKAILAVCAGRYIAGSNGALLAGIFVVVGHNWPIILKFRGGKGIASTIGVLIAINPLVVSILAFFGILILITTRYVSLASVVGMTLFPIVMLILHQPSEYILFSLILSSMAIFKHRSNIVRLYKGTESKLGKKVNIK